LFWLVLCTNAFNLIDGVDGLATGVGLFATLTMVLAAFLQHNLALAAATLPLAGFLLGFLRYNFNPASVFLGDSGSLLIGFLLGCYGVIWSEKSTTLLGMTAPLMAMFVPLLDVGLSIVRRFLRHQPIFDADRGHIHHRLLDRGLSPRGAVLLLYGACLLGALFSMAQTFAAQQYTGLIVLLFCIAAWIGIQHLGYVEFSVASRMLLTGSFQRMLDAQLKLRHFEQKLIEAENLEECWARLTEECRKLGFVSVGIYFRGRVLERGLNGSAGEPCWTVAIPLPEGGQIEMVRRFKSAEDGFAIEPLVGVLREHLPRKLSALVPAAQQQRRAVVSQGGD
jgi:UDP-GlcNAc:undecaprenyl-phosphate GlcNAc-1-phosphate transferase